MGYILMTSGISIYGHEGESHILVTHVSLANARLILNGLIITKHFPWSSAMSAPELHVTLRHIYSQVYDMVLTFAESKAKLWHKWHQHVNMFP